MSNILMLFPILLSLTFGALLFVYLYQKFSLTIVVLGLIFGMGWAGLSFYILCLWFNLDIWSILLLEMFLTIFLAIKCKKIEMSFGVFWPSKDYKLQRQFSYLVATSLLITILFFIVISVFHPYGNWDAWMIWNVKAIHLANGGMTWYLNESVKSLTHPGYPLLLPAILAKGLVMGGTNSTIVPIAVSWIFTVLSLALVFSIARSIRGIFLAFVALGVMIITPQFILEGMAQYADIPLACFALGAVSMLIYNLSTFEEKINLSFSLIGVLLGFALLLKNEGSLISISFFAAAFVLVLTRSLHWKNYLLMLIGILPFVFALIQYKHQVPAQDHLQAIKWNSSLINQAISNLPLVLEHYFSNLIKVFEAIGLVLVLIFVKSFNIHFKYDSRYIFIILFIMMVLGGDTIIYLIVSNAEFLLSTSSKRLLMQVFPILIIFIILNLSSTSQGQTFK